MAHSYNPSPEGKLSDLVATAQESKVMISEKNEQSLKDLAFGSVSNNTPLFFCSLRCGLASSMASPKHSLDGSLPCLVRTFHFSF